MPADQAAANPAAATVATLSGAAFAAGVRQKFGVRLLDGELSGQTLEGAVLATVIDVPRAAMPGSVRTPFILRFKVPDPGAFVGGLCEIEVPGGTWLGPVYCERTMPPTEDPTGAYFNIGFA